MPHGPRGDGRPREPFHRLPPTMRLIEAEPTHAERSSGGQSTRVSLGPMLHPPQAESRQAANAFRCPFPSSRPRHTSEESYAPSRCLTAGAGELRRRRVVSRGRARGRQRTARPRAGSIPVARPGADSRRRATAPGGHIMDQVRDALRVWPAVRIKQAPDPVAGVVPHYRGTISPVGQSPATCPNRAVDRGGNGASLFLAW